MNLREFGELDAIAECIAHGTAEQATKHAVRVTGIRHGERLLQNVRFLFVRFDRSFPSRPDTA